VERVKEAAFNIPGGPTEEEGGEEEEEKEGEERLEGEAGQGPGVVEQGKEMAKVRRRQRGDRMDLSLLHVGVEHMVSLTSLPSYLAGN